MNRWADRHVDGSWVGFPIRRLKPVVSACLLLLNALLLPCHLAHAAPLDLGTGPIGSAPSATQAWQLGELVNADGTLDLASGYRGNLDATGYRLVSGAGEEPRFATAAAVGGDEYWQPGFGSLDMQGMDDTVSALAADGAGNLYAGGAFTTAGGVVANHIAKWDGTTWSALGSGMDDGVYALAVDGAGNLYAGGRFTSAGGEAANHLAKWNGTTWSALGAGMDDGVDALVVDSAGNLYAGGIFTSAGAVAANYVAKWDGSTWSALGSGINGGVYALAVDSAGNLYAGGEFFIAGGVYAQNVAKWDGSTWAPLGLGVYGGLGPRVLALAVDSSGNLYASGDFYFAGGVMAANVAKWDGSAWAALGEQGGTSAAVAALAVDSAGNVYVGGEFTDAGSTAGGVTANHIARWDGSIWSRISSLGAGTDGTVYALAFRSPGNLYAGGAFTSAGGALASNIAVFGSSMDDAVYALAVDSAGSLYAGGLFTSASGVMAANHIAKWDGTTWAALGSGMNDYWVNALAVDGAGNLYAGGQFTSAGGGLDQLRRQMGRDCLVRARGGHRRCGLRPGARQRRQPLCGRRVHHRGWRGGQPHR
jgi:hypothetical protein